MGQFVVKERIKTRWEYAKLRVYSRDFWIITLATIVFCALTARLALWQLHRAQNKELLTQQLAHMAEQVPWSGAQLQEKEHSLAGEGASAETWKNAAPEVLQLAHGLPRPDWLYQPVVLSGHWLPAHTVYVENRPMHEQVGFWVFTPFVLEQTGAAILVQRGWLPRNMQDRRKVPIIPTATGATQIWVQLQGEPSKLPSFGSDKDPAAGGADIRLNVDLHDLRQSTHLPFLPYTAREMEHAQTDGLQRSWDPPALKIPMHQGYALQWAAMCLAALVLYLWFQWIKPWRQCGVLMSAVVGNQ